MIAPTSLDSKVTSSTNHASASSNSVTLPALAIIVVSIYIQNAGGAATTIASLANTAANLTFNRVGNGILHSGTQIRGEMYWAFNTSSQAAQTITATYAAATTDNSVIVIDYLTGASAAAWIQQFTSATTTATSVAGTLNAFSDPANATYAAVFAFSTTDDPVAGAGFTPVTVSPASNHNILTEFTSSADTSPDATIGTSSIIMILAVEIRDAATLVPGPVISFPFTADATSHSTTPFYVEAGRLCAVAWFNRVAAGTANTPTVSCSNGDTLTPQPSGSLTTSGSTLNRLTTYRWVPSTTGFVTLTGDYAGQTNTSAGVLIDQLPGAKTTGTNGADAVGQAAVTATSGFTTNPLVTLGSALPASSWIWGALISNTATVAPTAGWTELSETAQIEATFTLASQFKAASQNVSWATASALWAAAAIEFVALFFPQRVFVATAAAQRASSW